MSSGDVIEKQSSSAFRSFLNSNWSSSLRNLLATYDSKKSPNATSTARNLTYGTRVWAEPLLSQKRSDRRNRTERIRIEDHDFCWTSHEQVRTDLASAGERLAGPLRQKLRSHNSVMSAASWLDLTWPPESERPSSNQTSPVQSLYFSLEFKLVQIIRALQRCRFSTARSR